MRQLQRGLEDRGQLWEESIIAPHLQEDRSYRTKGTTITSSLCTNESVGLVEAVLKANDEAIISLQQIYDKVDRNTKNLVDLSDTVVWDTLVMLVQALQEGSDYLTNACLISKIAWYAEMIDPSYAASIQRALGKVIDQNTDFTSYRRAAESILGISSTLSVDPLDDQMAEDARRDLRALLRQLELRVKSNKTATPVTTAIHSVAESSTTTGASTSTPLTLFGSLVDTPTLSSAVLSPFSSRPSSPGASDFKSIDMKDLQTLFGTGVSTPATPLPGLSSFNATSTGTPAKPIPAPSSPAASVAGTDSSEEIWEYRGRLLTRSALDLVLRQETLAQADSSGQYAGEVSWDDLRGTWIPIWVKKLKVNDLAEGGIPDSSPAGFQERDTDVWGNKIGWYGPYKEMYYKEEPKWELKD
ncbi:hypothetical protein D1P53_001474 [Cryptococcus gattii VGV]|nr:hypothetical protein D1P53_001474 [Cryptococcus gattii VGV]